MTARTVPAIAAAPARNRRPGLIGALRNAIRNRRAVRDLLAMTDAQLSDIGITRGDVHSALLTPWHVDPSQKLRPLRRR